MYACRPKRENILKFVFSGELSELYTCIYKIYKILNNDCLFCITAAGSNAVRPSIGGDTQE